MTDQRGSAKNRRRSSAEIRSDIAATRARLGNDIDAARMKLSKRGLEREAKGALRHFRHDAIDAIGGVSHSADSQANQFGRIAVDAIKRYPVVTTLVGLGLAMLAFSNSRRLQSSHDAAGQEQEMPLVKRSTADLPPSRY